MSLGKSRSENAPCKILQYMRITKTEGESGMGQVIAGMYEILQEIGSGGGGIVYLARHLRLDKWVVLKADKRTLTTRPEVLRREVDALKDLSHTYIPQVYDFISEQGVVYTVMDYIEGESLDKPLKRGERFSQPQVIAWAVQILDALCYLHNRPPHGILHSDIKPANIMRTPQGDIRLIDFNIALALGEEGAVRVGFSRGYASPEHYGIEHQSIGKTQGVEESSKTEMAAPSYIHTSLPRSEEQSGNSSGTQGRTLLLDVRSDIYSLGATLYHLLSGRRPANEADKVEPLTVEQGVSPAVAAIVGRAMAPDPDRRYQTAADMLFAFKRLHENDPRAKRHRHRMATTAGVLAAVFLLGGASALTGLDQLKKAEAAARQVAEAAQQAAEAAEALERRNKEALAAIRSGEAAYQNGDISRAVDDALKVIGMDSPYGAQAQKLLTDALGIYDLSAGFKADRVLGLSGEPLKVVLSPGGTRIAVLTSGLLSIFNTCDGTVLELLPAEPSALADVVFQGENRVIYAGSEGICAYDLEAGRELWQERRATAITLSADGTTVAAVYKNEDEATIYDASTGDIQRKIVFEGRRQDAVANDIFADPNDNLFALNSDGTRLAVSFSDGALWVYDLRNNENDAEIYDISEFRHFEGGFYGRYFAFSATGQDQSVFAVVDIEEMTQTGGFASTMPFHVMANEDGIWVATENILVGLDPETGEQTETAYTQADITAFALDGGYTVVATDDDALSFFDLSAQLMERREGGPSWHFVQLAGDYAAVGSRDAQTIHLLRLDEHDLARIFAYDKDYAHNEARVSLRDGTVMLFRYDGFRLYDMDGELLEETTIPDAGEVYDQQYRREEDGCFLDVIYNSGLVRRYSAADGSLSSETQDEAPDGTLCDEYFTERLRIESPLHGTPAAYDRETGVLVRELETDDYLTYVTQIGEYVMTEYITTQGKRYGLLLDETCETLAELPGLCDILEDGTLIFDDMRGNLRESRIYSMQELIAFAKNNEGGD